MSEKTSIAWTDHTFNIAWGCTKIDPGCANCYADTLSTRYGHDIWGPNKGRRTFGKQHWLEPFEWQKKSPGSKVFCSSMCDIFEDHPIIEQELKKLWPLIQHTPFLTWQLLTKRADRIAASLPEDWSYSNYPNVWLGVSISEPKGLWRADELRKIDCTVRFVSYEPALADLSGLNLEGLHWVIYGGESGPKFRPDQSLWAMRMHDKCASAGVAFFYKQSAGFRSGMFPFLRGERIQEFPSVAARQTLQQPPLCL